MKIAGTYVGFAYKSAVRPVRRKPGHYIVHYRSSGAALSAQLELALVNMRGH